MTSPSVSDRIAALLSPATARLSAVNVRLAPVRRVLRPVTGRQEAGIILVLILLCIYLGLTTRSFLTVDNLFNIARNYSDIALGAIGITLVMITGGIDLSVGSIMAFAGLVAASAMTFWGLPVPVAMVVGVLGGGLVGLANGWLVQRLRLPPFIATLGTLGVTRGIVVGTTNGQLVNKLPDSFTGIGQGYIDEVPIPVIFLVVVAILVGLFVAHHVWGTYIYAIGGNETSARLTGLPVGRVKIFVYIMSGVLSGLAGVLVVSRLGVAAPTQSIGYELSVIAAAVIGGVSLQGGRGTILGAVLGAMIIGVLYNALVLLSVPTYWQQAFIGGIIILAAIVDIFRQRRT